MARRLVEDDCSNGPQPYLDRETRNESQSETRNRGSVPKLNQVVKARTAKSHIRCLQMLVEKSHL